MRFDHVQSFEEIMIFKKNIIRFGIRTAFFVGLVLLSSCKRELFEPQETISVKGYNPQDLKSIHSQVLKIAKSNNFSNEITFGNSNYKSTKIFQVIYKSVDDNSFISFKENSNNDCLIISAYTSDGSEKANEILNLIRSRLYKLSQGEISIQNDAGCF